MSADLITVPEAARRLGVSKATMYRWLATEDRPAFFLQVGKRWKVSAPLLEAYVGGESS